MQKQIQTVTIIGIGLIGGSLCAAMRRFLPELRVLGVDYPDTVVLAEKEGLIDAGWPREQLSDAVSDADLVLIATPIAGALELMPELKQACRPDTIISDVCSLKAPIMDAANKAFAGSELHFVGGHPMAGGERGGLLSADPFLFENAIYVLTPPPETPEAALRAFAALVEKLGSHVVLLKPEIHDEVAAGVSHLPQLLAVTLMRYAATRNQANPHYLKMAAGGFRDMTRIASSPFTIWRDICAGNRQQIADQIDGFIAALAETRETLLHGDLEEAFTGAARSRLSIPTDTRGFLTPHFDLLVEIEDKPGMIADISQALFSRGINIKDIEVLKVRENEGGTLRLAFESERDRRRAGEVLGERHRCRIRD